jgi:hypothetical protein
MKGFLHKTETGIRCELDTGFGMVTTLVGVPAERDGIRGYDVETVLEVPDGLKVPFVDDDPLEVTR